MPTDDQPPQDLFRLLRNWDPSFESKKPEVAHTRHDCPHIQKANKIIIYPPGEELPKTREVHGRPWKKDAPPRWCRWCETRESTLLEEPK